MTAREEAIQTLLTELPDPELTETLKRLERKIDLFLSVIVVQQKDACEAVGIHPDTVRSKVLAGETEILQSDGSRLNFLTLKTAGDLKKRKK